MNFDEKFSNARIDEGIKGEAIKAGVKKGIAGAKNLGSKAAAGAKAFGAKAKTAAGKAATGAKETYKKVKKYYNEPYTTTRGKVVRSQRGALSTGVVLGATASKLAAKKKAKNESLVEAMDRHIINMQNEAAIGAALKGAAGKVGAAAKNFGSKAGAKAKDLGAKAAAGAKKAGAELKAVGKNTVQGAKTVGGAIKKHPYRTAAVVGGAAGLGAGAVGAKKAYDNWKS